MVYNFLPNTPERAVIFVQGKCDVLKTSLLWISVEETEMKGTM